MEAPSTEDRLLDVAIELLRAGGYEAFQVRALAKQARVSLRTIYQLFGTRDALLVAALARWMEQNVYAAIVPPNPDLPPGAALVSIYRQLFEPWLREPGMLEAFHRARSAPGGEELDRQGRAVLLPMAKAVLDRLEPEYALDVGMIISHVFYAVVAQFTQGTMAEGEILPTLERTVLRLTSDNTALASVRQLS